MEGLAFATDGTPVLMLHRSAVATKLSRSYPNYTLNVTTILTVQASFLMKEKTRKWLN
jgi:hypothetical protein